MTWLDEPFYPVGRSTTNNVYVGGKPTTVAAEDYLSGVARMGGFWRHPNYLESYLTAAALLIEQGSKRKDYDDIGLPVFYLQRHTAELLLKRLLRWCIDIIELRADLHLSTVHQVPASCRKALGDHSLRKLLKSLTRVTELAGEAAPPENLTNLVELLTQIEKDDHWSRYDHGYRKDKKIIHHEREGTIPIVRLQELLEEVTESTLARHMGDETYENDLYSTWSRLNCLLEDIQENRDSPIPTQIN